MPQYTLEELGKTIAVILWIGQEANVVKQCEWETLILQNQSGKQKLFLVVIAIKKVRKVSVFKRHVHDGSHIIARVFEDIFLDMLGRLSVHSSYRVEAAQESHFRF